MGYMPGDVDARGFRDVEAAADPAALIAFLEQAAGVAGIRTTTEWLRSRLDLRRGHHVLDAGAGLGDEVRALAGAVGRSGRVVGVDSATMVAEATRRGTPHNGVFLEGDAQALPLEDRSFDRYRAHRVYMHLRDPRRALAEAVRVVRPGGLVLVSEPDWGALVVDSDDRAMTERVIQAIQLGLEQPWIGRQLPRLFVEAGLENVEVEPRFAAWGDFETAYELALRLGTDRLKHEGLADAGEIATWLDELREKARRGTFFVTGLIVSVRAVRQ